jgi:hypothetical protein
MISAGTIGRTILATLSYLWVLQAAAETVRITHNQPFPPFTEVKNGKSEGLAVDILRAAAGRVGPIIADLSGTAASGQNGKSR